ncbi:MAG: hypothetical protein AAF709_09955 [Pseudomonadota bacterium]
MSRTEDLIKAREDLEQALYSGARRIRIDDHEVEYANAEAIERRIQAINAELGDRQRVSVIRPMTSKGL